MKKNNLKTITLHQFRHSHATMLLTEGIIINEVSRRLGHSRVSTTLDVYTHTSLEQKKESTKLPVSNDFPQTYNHYL